MVVDRETGGQRDGGNSSIYKPLSADQFGDSGVAFDFNLPSSAALIGVPLHFQAASRKVGPIGPIHFSNAVMLEIFGPSGLFCIEPDC